MTEQRILVVASDDHSRERLAARMADIGPVQVITLDALRDGTDIVESPDVLVLDAPDDHRMFIEVTQLLADAGLVPTLGDPGPDILDTLDRQMREELRSKELDRRGDAIERLFSRGRRSDVIEIRHEPRVLVEGVDRAHLAAGFARGIARALVPGQSYDYRAANEAPRSMRRGRRGR